jgi:prevent-host-death family protein
MKMSIAEAKRGFSSLIKQAHREPVVVTRRGQPDVVILAFEEYRRLRRLRAYLRMLRLSQVLQDAGVTATELYQVSRQELEVARDLDALL